MILGKTCRVTQPLRSEVALPYLAAVTVPEADMARESMMQVLVVVTVTVTFLGSGAEGQALWNCDEVAQGGNFSFQQMVAGGPWLILEVISPVPGKSRDACITVDLVNSSSSSGDVLQVRTRSYDSQVVINETAEVRLYANDSALWELPNMGTLGRVTHVSDDGQLVALTVCDRRFGFDLTRVLGRISSTPFQQERLQQVRQSLAKSGLRNTDGPYILRMDNCNTTTT